MKIVKLDMECAKNVTIELSFCELNTIRTMLNKSVAIDEKHGFLINRFAKALVWEFNCIRNIAANGMIGPGDALDWVDKFAESVVKDDDCKAKVETETSAEAEASARASESGKPKINPETGEDTREVREHVSDQKMEVPHWRASGMTESVSALRGRG